MGSRELFYYYKETRLSLEPTSTATVLHAFLPSVNGNRRNATARITAGTNDRRGAGTSSGGSGPVAFLRGGGGHSRTSSGSHNGGGFFSAANNDAYTEEERAYRAQTLATESSVFHRKHHDAPRSFLWRVLECGDVLSIRAVDIGKADPAAPDAPMTLLLHFPNPIRPGCVAFADPVGHDILTVFVLDESSYLHYLQLRPDAFRRRSFTEADLGEWKPHLSSMFSIKQPLRLVAINAGEFAVSLNDGGMLHFERDYAHNDIVWKESCRSPVGLIQGLRSFIPFQGGPSVKYEGTSIELTAAISTVSTSMGLDDSTFLFSVCVDHTLRVWNVQRGEVVYNGDILGIQRQPHELGKWIIDPGQTNLIRILDLGEGVCVCVTYSPVGAGAFKFWKAAATADGKVDIQPFADAERTLVPPAPSSADVWTLADFAISHPESRKMSLWVLWKNNLIYRVMKMECAPENLQSAWIHGWLGVHADAAAPTAQTSGPCDPTDAVEKWLDLIFFPGRFSKATLETALAMYERGLGSAKESSSKGGKSLMESICAALGSTATLEINASGAMDYDLFRSTSEIQWRRFYRLIIELDKQRSEALSLVLDPDFGLTWVACTDSLSVIRECSELERIYHNPPNRIQNTKFEQVSRLLTAGATFLDGFSDGMLQLSEAALRSELFEDSSKTDEERIQWLLDNAGFWRYLTDDECIQVVDILGENFERVEETTYHTLFSLLEDVQTQDDARYPFTQFGQKLVIRGIQDTAELFWQILFRQLILLVHMEFEIEDEKTALRSRIDVGHVYIRLIDSLKRLELLRWLGKNEFTVALSKSARESLSGSFSGSFSANGSFSGSPSAVRRGDVVVDTQIVTALEGSVAHLLGLGELSGIPLASLLTDIIIDVCSAKGSIELDPAMIQCMLLKRERPDLSLQLGAFANDDPFSTYVQGRTFLALRDYDTAAEHFKRASVGLSVKLKHPPRHSAGLIDDAEWNLFYSGLPNYHAHIVSLYDRHRAFSFVVDFARLSLQFARPDDADTESIRTEMLSRLFTAAAALSRFDVAHSAVVSMDSSSASTSSSHSLQHSCLRYLVEKMCEANQVGELLGLPLPGLRDDVDDVLEQKSRAVVEVLRGTQWHQILYAWRIAHNDYRGAASALLDRLQKLREAGEGDKFITTTSAAGDALDTPVTRQYLMLINTLSCVDPKQAWIYTEDSSRRPVGASQDIRASVEVDDAGGFSQTTNAASETDALSAADQAKTVQNGTSSSSAADPIATLMKKATDAQRVPWRRVVTLAELRKQYQTELDRIAAIQNNQFAFGDEDDGDVSMDGF